MSSNLGRRENDAETEIGHCGDNDCQFCNQFAEAEPSDAARIADLEAALNSSIEARFELEDNLDDAKQLLAEGVGHVTRLVRDNSEMLRVIEAQQNLIALADSIITELTK